MFVMKPYIFILKCRCMKMRKEVNTMMPKADTNLGASKGLSPPRSNGRISFLVPLKLLIIHFKSFNYSNKWKICNICLS